MRSSQRPRATSRAASRPGSWRALVVALLLAPAAATGDAAGAGDAVELWLEARDARGRPTTIAAGDLELYEAGRPVEILALAPGPQAPPRITLYFDAVLAGPGTYRRGADALAAAADELTGLGEVEVVIADPEPRSVLVTGDGLALAERLGWLGASDRGRQALVTLRQRTLRSLRPRAGPSPPAAAEAAELVRRAIDEELEIVAGQQQHLLAWAAEARGDGPRVLVLVADGYDLDPTAFYRQHLTAEAAELVAGEPATWRFERGLEETARALAASGWTVLPLVAGASAIAVERPEEIIERPSPADPPRSGIFPGVVRRPHVTIGGGKKGQEAAEDDLPPASLVEPQEPLKRLAAASGGEVLGSADGLRQLIPRLAGRYALVYRSSLAAGAEPRPLELRSRRPGVELRARRWVSRSTPPPMVAARLRRLLAGDDQLDGGFDVAAVWRVTAAQEAAGEALEGELEARLSVAELAAAEVTGLERADLRVTIGWQRADGSVETRHEIERGQDLRALADWRYSTSLAVPADAGELAVLIENLADGRWGGALAAIVRADRAGVAAADLPQPAVIEILPPDEELLRGRVRFTTRVLDRRVARVSFLLDDEPVAEATERPFSARIDLGRSLRRRDLTVVAYDAAGAELGRNTVILNGGGGGLDVRIVSPEERRVSGPVDVEAAISVPLERRLDRVLFFWNNEQLATLFAPPFRQRLVIPDGQPGYVRVVAMLDDGSVAEDVVFLNGPQASERLDVDLVELYVVVTDEAGRPVHGLQKDDFTVREDGVEQQIAAFSDAGDLPLTIGMAIDSSASMFVKLPAVQRAAVRFLESTFGANDRAFVVDFDSRPRLARGTTGELDRVVRAINDLEADGRTALWESIVFSLVQLQGVRGRKALVVFSDGADEDDEFPYRACLKLARRMGVPIYLILMKREPKKENLGLALLTRSFTARAQKLVDAVGGRIYYAKDYPSLDEVYAEIERELRSQYLLAYYPQRSGGRGLWRDVDVVVARKGLRPRTLAGYWQ